MQRYRSYLAACNDRDWDGIISHVANPVLVNGVPRNHDDYIADIQATVSVFPDYRWDLGRAVVEGDWLSVHLIDTGTREHEFRAAPGDGSRVVTDEFVMYRWRDSTIVQLEGTADNYRLCQ